MSPFTVVKWDIPFFNNIKNKRLFVFSDIELELIDEELRFDGGVVPSLFQENYNIKRG